MATVSGEVSVTLACTIGVGKLIHYRFALILLAVVVLTQSIRQNQFLLPHRDEIPVGAGFKNIEKDKTIYYTQLPQDVLLKLVFIAARPVKYFSINSETIQDLVLWLLERHNFDEMDSSVSAGFITNYCMNVEAR